MTDLPYSFEPVAGYDEYKLTSILRDYMAILMKQPEGKETINQILDLINGYIVQLKNLRVQNREATTKEVYKAIDFFFDTAPAENKKGIQCKEACTACCFIDVDVCGDEAAVIINYCKEHAIEIDIDYLNKQAAVGRKTYSALSRCVFLKDNLCSIYPVRPVACRKHWVKTDPVLCDFSKNAINQIGAYFDVNTEILASALLNVEQTGSLEKILMTELNKTM